MQPPALDSCPWPLLDRLPELAGRPHLPFRPAAAATAGQRRWSASEEVKKLPDRQSALLVKRPHVVVTPPIGGCLTT